MSTQKRDEIVTWSPNYDTGVSLLDTQHRELIAITNNLYKSCLTDKEETVFKETMQQMVEYVRFHFKAEIELLERINYPDIFLHKKEHEYLIMRILDAVQDYGDGKKFVPNTFVRELKEWILGHIAISDKQYATYIATQKKKGLLSDSQLGG